MASSKPGRLGRRYSHTNLTGSPFGDGGASLNTKNERRSPAFRRHFRRGCEDARHGNFPVARSLQYDHLGIDGRCPVRSNGEKVNGWQGNLPLFRLPWRNVFQPWDRGLLCIAIYFATEVWPTATPSLRSSPWIRRASICGSRSVDPPGLPQYSFETANPVMLSGHRVDVG